MFGRLTARSGIFAIAFAFAALGASVAFAQATPLSVTQGKIQLPTSGLTITSPAAPDTTYKVSGSWSFDADDGAFDTRDVVDEANTTTGALMAGNWIMIGYFTAGDCTAVVNFAELDASSIQTTNIWSHSWTVRTGVYTFSGALGRRATAVMCTTNADGRSLLLYRFILDKPETISQSEIMANVRSASVLERATHAWREKITEDVQPLRRPEVRNRGTNPAARKVTLPVHGLTIDIPDDGYFWLVEKGSDADETDMLTRLLPSEPEVVLDLLPFEDLPCAEALSMLPADFPSHRATDLPAGWTAGAAINVNGERELVACHATSYGSLLVGVFQGPTKTSLGWLKPMLEALARGTLSAN